MIPPPVLLSAAAVVMGIGLVITGLEALPAGREAANWQETERGAVRLRVSTMATGLLLVATGACFVVWPSACLHGGGLLAAALLLYCVVVLLRPMGDGADLMLVMLLAGIGASELFAPDWLRTWIQWCLALNVCWAYWWSGAAKLKLASWREGRALALILNSRRYGRRWVAWQLLDNVWLARVGAWGAIGLEVVCPLFLALGGYPLLIWALATLVMHLVIAVTMGLPRFVWTFGAALLILLAVRG